jgi:DNA helicase-2/ATP-dependent DNA helicase PcrA
MTTDELIKIIFPPAGKKQLTNSQEDIINHPSGPGWVIAGPGSGKTEVLTLLALRLVFVDKVDPRSVIVTTFTEKAAKNLEDRIASHRDKIVKTDPALRAIDITQLRVGTLHGLCNDLLQEYRDPAYQNVRLMDEFEQTLLIYEHLDMIQAKTPDIDRDHEFWSFEPFPSLFRMGVSNLYDWKPSNRDKKTGRKYLPSKMAMAGALMQLFNRIVDERVDVDEMRKSGGKYLARLADIYAEYATALSAEHRCDFSHLQQKFLSFLRTPLGQSFLNGNEEIESPGIKWVLVDEYQDTNPIQEAIYLELAKPGTRNLVVVGDDDQAMYRFRGGSVECMVSFDKACESVLGITPGTVKQYPMLENFRSHPNIVTFCNDFIDSFPSMKLPGARSPRTSGLIASSTITGSYDAVGILRRKKVGELPVAFAAAVKSLVDEGVVNDASECCLLLTSTKDSATNAGPFMTALKNVGLDYFNPRNKGFVHQEEVSAFLGTLFKLIDPDAVFTPDNPKALHDLILGCRATFDRIAAKSPELDKYIKTCHARFKANPKSYVTSNLQEAAYLILSLEPFASWQNDIVKRQRLGQLTAILETYCSLPYAEVAKKNFNRGTLKVSATADGSIVNGWTNKFYYLVVSYLSRKGLDDAEDDDVICPLGKVPIMTMHQVKGLQFPFVFVGHMGETPEPTSSHFLEDLFRKFPQDKSRSYGTMVAGTRAELDLIRQYFVAFSRPQYALILLATDNYLKSPAVPCGGYPGWLKNTIDCL